MRKFFSAERNTQMLIALLKAHGINKIIASPGTTNVNFVGSVENDSFFEVYSCVDERSAAYMACGLAAETGNPVVITCTGATASRNYLPALTEAYYRKLPILAITGMQPFGRIGSYTSQVIDRSQQPKDTVRLSVHIPASLPTEEDEWAANVQINRAILELTHRGGGPVHIDLQTNFTPESCEKPKITERIIRRITYSDVYPSLPVGRIGVFVGAHKKWSDELTNAVDCFCSSHDAVVLCDNTSNFWGKYRVQAQLQSYQSGKNYDYNNFDLVIHIGDVSGSGIHFRAKEVWRVDLDGEIRDTFKKLTYVFEMKEVDFFLHYINNNGCVSDNLLKKWQSEYKRLYEKIPELPFSNIWVAQNTIGKLPENSVIHFGIWNSLMSWNYFTPSHGVLGFSNTGGFGIDGGVSSLIGASFCNSDKLYFGIVGDLAFFYDMNAIGNRHVNKNLRIMLINNGCGVQFHLSGNYSQRVGISDAEVHKFIAAGGHFGNQSSSLVKHYAMDLGFEYISAKSKKEYLEKMGKFISSEVGDKPIFFEIFIEYHDDPKAENMIRSVDSTVSRETRTFVKNVIGEKNIQKIKKIIKQ